MNDHVKSLLAPSLNHYFILPLLLVHAVVSFQPVEVQLSQHHRPLVEDLKVVQGRLSLPPESHEHVVVPVHGGH